MLPPPLPADEARRLDTLRRLNILDTAAEERFDRVTRLARRLFDAPVALVSLVDENRQWFKSRAGFAETEGARQTSFCGHAILSHDIFLIPDALQDERFRDNPLVTGAPGIRFYAGCPLTVPNGSRLGTLCVFDVKPRTMSEEDQSLLRDLARMVEEELAAVELANMDELTQLSNRRGFVALAQHALTVCDRLERPATLLFFDMDGFKTINDRFGHAEGDRALRDFATELRESLGDFAVIGRLGGDEFVALLSDVDCGACPQVMATLRERLTARQAAAPRGYTIAYSVGSIQFDPHVHDDIGAMLAQADAAMYANKAANKSAGKQASEPARND